MRVLVAVLTLALALSGDAFAQRAEAQDAFERGRKQMKEGDYVAACASFETSLKLEHTIGTLYNLGLCHEKLGKIASAWAELKQVAATDTNKARAADAQKRVEALEPRLTRFKITVTESVPGLTIEREGLDMTSLVGQAVPVDPRTYKFTASAPGYKVATIDAALDKAGATVDVTIPRLESVEPSSRPTPRVPHERYPAQLALRPITMPDGMAEVFGSSAASTSASRFEQSPIDGLVGGRFGIQKFEVGLRAGFHLRYEQDQSTRPNPWSTITGTIAYAIQPQFVAMVEYSRMHPIGDLGKGSTFRALLARRQLIVPRIAFDGTAGFAFPQRGDFGSNVSELVLEATPGLIATATPKLSLAAYAALEVNAGGDLFGHTLGLGFVPQALFAMKPNVDIFARIFLGLLPAVSGGNSSDLRSYIIGVNWRP
jgi:hypothetical protein